MPVGLSLWARFELPGSAFVFPPHSDPEEAPLLSVEESETDSRGISGTVSSGNDEESSPCSFRDSGPDCCKEVMAAEKAGNLASPVIELLR